MAICGDNKFWKCGAILPPGSNRVNPGDFRKGSTSHGGGLMIYIRKGTPCKRMQQYKERNIESICFKIAINRRKWLIFAIYRPPYHWNLQSFFQYFDRVTDNAFDKYENVITLRDINTDIKRNKGGNLSFLTTSVKLLASKIWSKRSPVLPKPLHFPLNRTISCIA